MNNILDENILRDCTGCGMCSAVCPTNAIKIELNSQGFYNPAVNEDTCVNCSLCKKVCYKFDKEAKIKESLPIECFSAVNKNDEELQNCSSGGVSIELMRECLKQGYYVVGVAYDYKKDIAVTKIAKSDEELEVFRGSKYFQSYTEEAFKSVINDKSGQKYAIFGTPCQIYAFNKLSQAKGNSSKYIFIDIFCHGCPSLNLWKKYLLYQKNKLGVKEFDKIKFRSKTYNWHEFAFEFFSQNHKYLSEKYNNPFYEMFFSKDVMNNACYDCITRSNIQYTDIRLGDFWGSQFDSDTKGVSAVVINTERGQRLFSAVAERFNVKAFSFGEVIAAQSYGKIHNCNIEKRKKSLQLINGDMTINEAVKKYRKMNSLKTNIKRMLKTAIKHLPSKVYICFRGLSHKF